MGVSAPGLGGPWGCRRARAEVTEERVPFLEIVSEPLGQGRVRGAVASSLVIKEVIKRSEAGGARREDFYLLCLIPCSDTFSLSPPLKFPQWNDVSVTAHLSLR